MVEIIDESSNNGVNLVGVIPIAFHSGECMRLSGSSTDHVVNLPGPPPVKPLRPICTTGIFASLKAMERYAIAADIARHSS